MYLGIHHGILGIQESVCVHMRTWIDLVNYYNIQSLNKMI